MEEDIVVVGECGLPSKEGPNTYIATIWFPDGMYIPSTNYLYKPGIRGGKFPYLYKEESVEEFQALLVSLGEETQLIRIREIEYFSLSLDLTFFIRDRFWRRDVSNCVKSVEDAIVRIIGIDDSRVVCLTAKKIKQQHKREGVGIRIDGQLHP